jgi:hypothetical protein
MARRRYRMTPARRAALRKAQLASAQKRKAQARSQKRKKVAKRVAIGTIVTGAAGVGGRAIYGHRISGARPAGPPSYTRAIRPARVRGNPLNDYRKTYDRKKRRWVSVPPGGVFKVPGVQFRPRATHVQRLRPEYDAKRRKAYAKAKRKK